MTETELTLANGGFHVRLWSEGDGPPLLYLHGLDGPPGAAPFVERLASHHRVLMPEHPGFGESTGIDHIDNVIDMVLFHRELVERLDLGPVDVVGHSLGGMFAAEFAALCPQLVRRLVLVSPFGLWLEEAEIPDLFTMTPAQLARITWHDPEGERAQAALSQAANGYSGIQAIVKRAGNLASAGKFLWPIPDRGLARRLPFIKAPTLIVLGESDRLIPLAYGDAFAARIPNARLATTPDAGHAPMLEQPEAFGAVVEEFLS